MSKFCLSKSLSLERNMQKNQTHLQFQPSSLLQHYQSYSNNQFPENNIYTYEIIYFNLEQPKSFNHLNHQHRSTHTTPNSYIYVCVIGNRTYPVLISDLMTLLYSLPRTQMCVCFYQFYSKDKFLSHYKKSKNRTYPVSTSDLTTLLYSLPRTSIWSLIFNMIKCKIRNLERNQRQRGKVSSRKMVANLK